MSVGQFFLFKKTFEFSFDIENLFGKFFKCRFEPNFSNF